VELSFGVDYGVLRNTQALIGIETEPALCCQGRFQETYPQNREPTQVSNRNRSKQTTKQHPKLRMALKEEWQSRTNSRNSDKPTKTINQTMQYLRTRRSKSNSGKPKMEEQHQNHCNPNLQRILGIYRQNMDTTKI